MKNIIFRRTSVRQFLDAKVEDEKIELLLKAAMQAPSATNQQPWEFYAITNSDVIAKLAKASMYTSFVAKAPLVIVPVFKSVGLNAPELKEVDCAIACENILLEAVDLQMGGTFCAVYPDQERMESVVDTLGIPEDLTPFAMLAIGYPAKEMFAKNRFDEAKIHYIR